MKSYIRAKLEPSKVQSISLFVRRLRTMVKLKEYKVGASQKVDEPFYHDFNKYFARPYAVRLGDKKPFISCSSQ
jgi:hypothetical protein